MLTTSFIFRCIKYGVELVGQVPRMSIKSTGVDQEPRAATNSSAFVLSSDNIPVSFRKSSCSSFALVIFTKCILSSRTRNYCLLQLKMLRRNSSGFEFLVARSQASSSFSACSFQCSLGSSLESLSILALSNSVMSFEEAITLSALTSCDCILF